MKIVISGSSGLVGTALVNSLRSGGHEICRLVRSGSASFADGTKLIRWEPPTGSIDLPALENADAVVHLAGASIAGGRWTPARKELLRRSRVDATRHLVSGFAQLKNKPSVFISASAIGFYGNRGDEVLSETSQPGDDFLAQICRAWETESANAERESIRTVVLRFGIILAKYGGALKQMLLPFRLGLGGRLGDGRQWMSWIALDDVVSLIRSAIETDALRGPVNAVAPNPVRNSEFTSVLAAALHRPALFPVPRPILRLALGEMSEMLVGSERVIPVKLAERDFTFQHPELKPALQWILG